ncbi:hypothetical protein L1887_03170 [Cichorium endivia]|nr:hypothetical protein L1887_03170 [Cichorium endivia]
MHRSSSATMFRTTTDEYFLNLLPPVKPSEDLPVYNPISPDGTKKEHYKSPRENAIHLIPVVLILCGFILWFFSHPIGELTESNNVVDPSGDGDHEARDHSRGEHDEGSYRVYPRRDGATTFVRLLVEMGGGHHGDDACYSVRVSVLAEVKVVGLLWFLVFGGCHSVFWCRS